MHYARLKCAAAALLVIQAAPLATLADDAPSDRSNSRPLDEIVVVAHKEERSIRDVAANVTVLSQQDLVEAIATSVSDVFRFVPGVDDEGAGVRFGAEGINIRGIGGNRVAILVDGAPLPDQFDTGSFSNATRDFIDAGFIHGVEVLHGPASALYGSSAIGGVVAVTTPDPAGIASHGQAGGQLKGTVRGRDDSIHGQGILAFNHGNHGLLAGYSRREGEQIKPAAVSESLDTRDYLRETGLLKYIGSNRFGHSFYVSGIRQDGQTLSALNSVLGTGRYRSTTALEGDDRQQLSVVNMGYEFGAVGGFVDSGIARAFRVRTRVEQQTLDVRAAARTAVSIDRLFSYDQDVRGVELNVFKSISGRYISHRIGAGFEYRTRRTAEFRDGISTNLASGERTNVLLGEVFPLRDFPVSDTRESAAFLEDTLTIGERLTVIAGLRIDRYRLDPDVDQLYLSDFPDYETTRLDESDLSPKLGIIFNLAPAVDTYIQYSHGFRAPPYSDANVSLEIPLFGVRAVPNPDLKSESSDGIDIGLRWFGDTSAARIALFRTDYKDFIETKVNIGRDVESGFILFQSQNIGDTVIEGVEAGFSTRFGRFSQYAIDGAVYYARGRNSNSGEPINSVGPAQAVVEFSWDSANARRQLRLKSKFSAAYDRLDETAGTLFKPSGYAVFDIYLKQKLGNNAAMRIGIHNLADRAYWNWSDVRGLSDGDPVLPYLAQAGRTASASIELNW